MKIECYLLESLEKMLKEKAKSKFSVDCYYTDEEREYHYQQICDKFVQELNRVIFGSKGK